MATAPAPSAPRQLVFDVERPILMRPRRDRSAGREAAAVPTADRQMEFRMSPSTARPTFRPPAETPRPVVVETRTDPVAVEIEPEPFGAWLLGQTKRSGPVGELAKAVRLDRGFPKRGSVDDVRRHFGLLGADGDAFDALDDAERAYDRQ